MVRAVYRSLRQTTEPDPAVTAGVPRLSRATGVPAGPASESLRAAGAAVRRAFEAYATQMRPIYATTLYTGLSSAATVSGIAARVAPVPGGPSTLRTTVAVNTQPSTVRSSSAAVGLNVTPAASSLQSNALGLDLSSPESPSTLRSTAEMNTAATSLGSYSLSFASSTSQAQLSGAFAGSATSLSFNITTPTTISGVGSLLSFTVTDQNGTQVASFTGTVTAGQVIDVGATGLTVRFTSGTLIAGSSATTVSQTATDVSTTALFGAGWATAPRFESFQQVTAGSFTINGTTIAVNTNDSIDTVVARINSSGAGVTASVSGDRLTLTSTSNSEDDIVVGNDSSGFLAATKLASATTTRGNVRDDQQVLSKTSQFASVVSGSFTINGVSISVNKDTDSLSSIVSRINSSGAGVTASVNASADRLEIVTSAASEAFITVGNDTTGFLSVAGLNTNNTVRGNLADDTQTLAGVAEFGGAVNGTFQINGVSISVDPAADSVQSIVTRINNAGAGVTASYNAGTDRFVITPNVAGATLTVGSDTSGFLAAIGMATGTTATRANVDGAFNATGTNGPLLDPGFSVQAGSFTVNGVSIAVAADDTINTVLARITASAAGVTASYDTATETMTLSGTQPITVANDTSGFLAAVKLDGTAESTSQNAASAFDAALDDMSEYSAVQSGTVTVNGQQIAVNPATTTVRGLVTALNALPDLWASLEEATGKITVGTLPGGSATIADTSGVLAALGIAVGTHTGTTGQTTALERLVGSAPTHTADVVAGVAAAVEQMNAVLAQVARERTGQSRFEESLKTAVGEFADALRSAGAAGVTVATDDAAPAIVVDRTALERALNGLARPADARTVIVGIVDAFTARMGTLAAPVEPPPKTTVAVQVGAVRLIDPEIARSRMASARSAARASTYRTEVPRRRSSPADDRAALPGATTGGGVVPRQVVEISRAVSASSPRRGR